MKRAMTEKEIERMETTYGPIIGVTCEKHTQYVKEGELYRKVTTYEAKVNNGRRRAFKTLATAEAENPRAAIQAAVDKYLAWRYGEA